MKVNKKTRIIKSGVVTLHLREKGNWRFLDRILPLAMWCVGLVSMPTKIRWYTEYTTVVPRMFNKTSATMYTAVGADLKVSSETVLHEARHVLRVNSVWYLLWAWYRLSEELYAYEVQFGKQVSLHGYVPESYLLELADDLHKMYFLWPFMSKKHVIKEVRHTVDRVEARARIR